MKKRTIIWDILYPSVFMGLAVVVITMIVYIAAAFITGVRYTEAQELRYVPAIAGIAFYLYTLISQRKQFSVDEMRFGQDLRRVSVPFLLVCIASSACLSDVLERVISVLGLYQIFPTYETYAVQAFEGQNMLLLILESVILAPLAEELMFRGMTYRRVRQYFGVKWAALLSALLFGVYHANMIQLIYAFCLGLLFAWTYESSGTLIAPVCCHAAANAWALAMENLIDRPQLLSGAAKGCLIGAEAVIGAAALVLLIRHRNQTGSIRT